MIPRGPSVTAQELLAERRAVVNELRESHCRITREMLAADIDRIDQQLAENRRPEAYELR